MDTEEFFPMSTETVAAFKKRVLNEEQEFLSGLADLCNVYGYRIRSGVLDKRINPLKPISYTVNPFSGELMHSRN